MRVNWSKRAIAELGSIADYIERDDPAAAERVATRIFDRVMSLSTMAERGKPGRLEGTRELFPAPWPYFIVFRIVAEDVRILRVRHTSRRWPQ